MMGIPMFICVIGGLVLVAVVIVVRVWIAKKPR